MKSPGPDRYNSGLFEETWTEISPLVSNAVQDFFSTSRMPKFFDATKLVLLPKVSQP